MVLQSYPELDVFMDYLFPFMFVCVGVGSIEGCESDSAGIDGLLWPARACLKICGIYPLVIHTLHE